MADDDGERYVNRPSFAAGTETAVTEVDPRLNRLSFRAWRRGFREADLVLGPFVDRIGPELSANEIDELDELLNTDDHDLYGWIIQNRPTPPAHETALMGKIRAFMREHVAGVVARGAG